MKGGRQPGEWSRRPWLARGVSFDRPFQLQLRKVRMSEKRVGQSLVWKDTLVLSAARLPLLPPFLRHPVCYSTSGFPVVFFSVRIFFVCLVHFPSAMVSPLTSFELHSRLFFDVLSHLSFIGHPRSITCGVSSLTLVLLRNIERGIDKGLFVLKQGSVGMFFVCS